MKIYKFLYAYKLSHGSEEDRRQHYYINWYYEQKEKFTKRFLNRDKKVFDK